MGGLEAFFENLIRASAEATVLLLLVLGAQTIFKRRLSAQWRYGLWLVVVVRLLVPVLPESAFSVFNWVPRIEPVTATEFVVEAKPGYRGASVDNFTDVLAPVQPESVLFKKLALLWLAGTCCFLGVIILHHWRLQKFVGAQRQSTDPSVLNLLEDCKAEMNLRTPVAVVVAPHIKSPALFGVIRPRILLPSSVVQTLSQEELRFILLHELGHIKQLDVCLNWVAAVLQALHWFNPLVWLTFAKMRADRELACDAVVLHHIGEKQSVSYGETLLKMVQNYSRPVLLPSTAGILEDRSQMRERILSISRYRRSLGLSAIGIVTLLVLALLGLTSPLASSRPVPAEKYLVVKRVGNGNNPKGDADNRSFRFDGEKNFLRLGNEVGNFQTNDFTIEFWMSTRSPLHWNIMGKRSVCNAADFWEIRGGGTADETGNIGLEIRVKGEQNDRIDLQSARRINDGEYHHVAFVREGRTFRCFVDGEMESSVESKRLLDIHNAANLYLGIGPCVGIDETRLYNGTLSQVAFHLRALTADELRKLSSTRPAQVE